jgi:two-component system CheB/CheR fusion protein
MGATSEEADQERKPGDGLAEAAATPYAAAGERVAEGTPADAEPEDAEAAVPIVAIGASAGGLEAIEQFFAAVTEPCRFAFVIIQHLSPDFKSLMVELLARRTPLAVRAVEDGMAPAANAIHLIPPGKTMTIEAGLLRLAERNERELVHHPIDEFFVSLATDRGAAAIGIVLSGSGGDGSRGARAIRRSGGRVLVQLPATAKFSSMPQSAIEAGCAEEVMAPDAMAKALLEAAPRPSDGSDGQAGSSLTPELVDCLDRAFGIDFSDYRNETVQRRLQRRMMLRGFDQLDAYAAFVADDPDEQEALYQDLLIGVTAFFRDVEAFEALEREVVPELAARLDAGEEVRIWVPACATGEEAYSIAILLLAHCVKPLENSPLRVFATDVHRRSLAVAGTGFYSEEAVGNVRAEWLRRFFAKRGSGYQVVPVVRRTIIFSPHDLLRDPPFTKLQLISCRNFMIYLQRAAQARVVGSFAHALQPGGYLLLGPSESTSSHEDAFATIDREARLFRRRRNAASVDRGSVVAAAMPALGRPLTVTSGDGVLARERRDQRLSTAYELLLDSYVPPSLLVDENGQVVHCFGDAGAYLKAPRGRPSLAVLDMVRDELRAPLASAINRVKRTGHPITLARLPLGAETDRDGPVLQRLVVEVPADRPEAKSCLLVSFDDRAGISGHPEMPLAAELDDQTLSRIDELERDLRFSEESLKTTIEELETANDELQAANEELMATNEELMAANEELHSVNEEMHTVGIEHQRKIEELLQLGQDMDSLLDSAELAALFIDRELKVRRFTPALTHYFNLMPQDVGRPLDHVTHHFAAVDMATLLQTVISTGEPGVYDLETLDGGVARLRAVPYRVVGQSIAGVTVSVLDVTASVRRDATSRALEAALAELLDAATVGMAVLRVAAGDDRLQVMAGNASMAEAAHAAGIAPPLVGTPLASLVGALVGGAAAADLEEAVSDPLRDGDGRTHRWRLDGGEALTLRLAAGEGGVLIGILTLAGRSDLSSNTVEP